MWELHQHLADGARFREVLSSNLREREREKERKKEKERERERKKERKKERGSSTRSKKFSALKETEDRRRR